MTSVITEQLSDHPFASGTVAETPVDVKPASARDVRPVLAMLGRCSRTSLFHRFHGHTDGVAFTRSVLVHQQGGATVAAWNHDACIGLATLGCDGAGVFHLGVLVEDAWQRRGVGRQLLAVLLDWARAHGAAAVHADVLGEDGFIVEALRRLGGSTVSIYTGTYSIDINLT
jgi:GNAT superfamily N-acetyltransferase